MEDGNKISPYLTREYGPLPTLTQNKKVPYETLLYHTKELFHHYQMFRDGTLDDAGERNMMQHFLMYTDNYCIGFRAAFKNVLAYKKYINSWRGPQYEFDLEQRIAQDCDNMGDIE